jgi:hypothetical protein
LGEDVRAPADAVVIASWKANWGWGEEGALLIKHTEADLGLAGKSRIYFSEFDHLDFAEVESFHPGDQILRGQKLASVYRPGGDPRYLPEVHWEVWEIEDESATLWSTNRYDGPYWTNPTGRLIDPLSMFGLNGPRAGTKKVPLAIFDNTLPTGSVRGFSYILPCVRKSSIR